MLRVKWSFRWVNGQAVVLTGVIMTVRNKFGEWTMDGQGCLVLEPSVLTETGVTYNNSRKVIKLLFNKKIVRLRTIGKTDGVRNTTTAHHI